MTSAPKRRHGNRALFEVAAGKTGCLRAFGNDQSGVDRVDTNLFRSKFHGQNASQGVDCAFGGAIDRIFSKALRGNEAAYVYDAAPRLRKALESELCHQEH